MLLRIASIIVLLFTTLASNIQAQEPSDIVEVYGLVLTKSTRGNYEYIPFVTVAVKGTTRGTYANYEGMYSIVVKKGQTVTFSAVGFAPREIVIPEDITGMYYSLTVEMEPAEVNLDEVTVFPWPDRDNLAAEFLAMQPNKAGQLEALPDGMSEMAVTALMALFGSSFCRPSASKALFFCTASR